MELYSDLYPELMHRFPTSHIIKASADISKTTRNFLLYRVFHILCVTIEYDVVWRQHYTKLHSVSFRVTYNMTVFFVTCAFYDSL